MLSDDALENLMQPIIDRQEVINNYVIKVIANRVKAVGKLQPKDLQTIKTLVKSGADIVKINAMLAKETGLQIKDIKSLIKTVAEDSYIDAKPFYDYRHKSFIPFDKNTELKKISTAIGKETGNTYKNIMNTKATGFYVVDKKHPGNVVFKTIDDTYKDTIDTAIQAVQNGSISYELAVRKTVQQLADSGIRRISWDSGYTKRLDAAVRQAIHDGVKALQLQMQRQLAEEIDADGWRLSAHQNSAPDHEPIQGHVFTLDEFEKLQSNQPFKDTWGNSFGALKRIIGQWNCRHWFRAIIIGKDTGYKQETLQKYIENNAKGYTLPNGKHLTMYQCTQYMRRYEQQIRDLKEKQMAAKESGDLEEAKRLRAKVVSTTSNYKAFAKDCGLGVKKDKIVVYGYK